MDLLGTLGLDQVEDDPNFLPDNKYGGVVYKAEYLGTKKGKLALVITYKVNDGGKFNGREKPEWWTIGDGKVENGNPVLEKPTMSETQKGFFKGRLKALGIPETMMGNVSPETLKGIVGTEVFFGTKTNNGYNNINFVERRNPEAQAAAEQSVDPWTGQSAPTPPANPGGLADSI